MPPKRGLGLVLDEMAEDLMPPLSPTRRAQAEVTQGGRADLYLPELAALPFMFQKAPVYLARARSLETGIPWKNKLDWLAERTELPGAGRNPFSWSPGGQVPKSGTKVPLHELERLQQHRDTVGDWTASRILQEETGAPTLKGLKKADLPNVHAALGGRAAQVEQVMGNSPVEAYLRQHQPHELTRVLQRWRLPRIALEGKGGLVSELEDTVRRIEFDTNALTKEGLELMGTEFGMGKRFGIPGTEASGLFRGYREKITKQSPLLQPEMKQWREDWLYPMSRTQSMFGPPEWQKVAAAEMEPGPRKLALETATKMRPFWDRLRELAGDSNYFTDYLPLLPKDPKQHVDIDKIPQKMAFFANMLREGTVSTFEKDPAVLLQAYIRRGVKTRAWNEAKPRIDRLLSKITNPVEKQVAEDHFKFVMLGEVPGPRGRFSQWIGEKLTLAAELMPGNTGAPIKKMAEVDGAYLDRLMREMVYTSYLGLRPSSAVKNYTQKLLTSTAVSKKNWGRALYAVRTKAGQQLVRDSQVIPAHFLPVLEGGGQGTALTPVARAVLTHYRAVDTGNRAHAFLAGYYDFHDALAKPGLFKKMMGKMHADYRDQIVGLLKQGQNEEAARVYGREISNTTQWVYGPHNRPVALQSLLGRATQVLMTWPMNFGEKWVQWIKTKDGKAIATWLLGSMALQEGFHASGISTESWFFLGPLTGGGNPALSIIRAGLEAWQGNTKEAMYNLKEAGAPLTSPPLVTQPFLQEAGLMRTPARYRHLGTGDKARRMLGFTPTKGTPGYRWLLRQRMQMIEP
ncbi:MAG: hypothetical protein KKH61_20980 [Gammaproteobacteria bacterium]|nr:hypothetical protein [Gammaproteobacteria bacterium]